MASRPDRKKIVTVLGARPQFIKASTVSRAIRANGALHEVVAHTGQHFDDNMSKVFFDELEMDVPAHMLGIHGGTHGAMTGRMLADLEQVLLAEKPDAVLVYGDTNSTLAGALAAVKLHIPVAHVEAGLRSFNMRMPEEVNRMLTDRISRWLFTPTDAAAAHLAREGAPASSIIPSGDVMFDAALHFGNRAATLNGAIAQLGLKPRQYILATVHRAENTDDERRLAVIVDALTAAANTLPVVWPMHPRTRAILDRDAKLSATALRLHLIDPVGYIDMVQLEKNAAVIATDSGGVQKEAYFYRVPCVTLRDETEWIELVSAGWNRLAPPLDASTVHHAIRTAIGTYGANISPYGTGDAAQKIVARLASDLSG